MQLIRVYWGTVKYTLADCFQLVANHHHLNVCRQEAPLRSTYPGNTKRKVPLGRLARQTAGNGLFEMLKRRNGAVHALKSAKPATSTQPQSDEVRMNVVVKPASIEDLPEVRGAVASGAPVSECRIHITPRPTQMMLDEIAAFQASTTSGTVQQSLVWPDLNRPEPDQEYQYYIAKMGPRVMSGGLIRFRRVAAGYTVASIVRGPVTTSPEDARIVLLSLEEKLHELGVITLTVNPYWAGAEKEAAVTALRAAGYQPVNRVLQYFPTATAILDTTKEAEALLNGMTQTGRRHLRKAMNQGVTCRPMASFEEALRANEIMVGMAEETGLSLDSQYNFVAHYEYLKTAPKAGSILVTELDGTIFGAAVNYLEGARGYNMLLTTSSEVDVPRSYVLMWESILSMKALGATSFDMSGYPDDDVETHESIRARGAFKEGFGPKIVKLPPSMSKPLRPLLHGAVTTLRGVRQNYKTSKATGGGR